MKVEQKSMLEDLCHALKILLLEDILNHLKNIHLNIL